MGKTLSISEARKHLPALLREVAETGQPLTIEVRGKALVRILPALPESEKDRYPLRGLGSWISPDFDEPMDELWAGLDEPVDPTEFQSPEP